MRINVTSGSPLLTPSPVFTKTRKHTCTHTHSLHAWSHNWHEGQHAYRQKQPDGLPTNQQCVHAHIRKWFLIISFYILHLVFSDFLFLFCTNTKRHTLSQSERMSRPCLSDYMSSFSSCVSPTKIFRHFLIFLWILGEEGLELQPSPALTWVEMTAPPCLYSLYNPTVRLVFHCTISHNIPVVPNVQLCTTFAIDTSWKSCCVYSDIIICSNI